VIGRNAETHIYDMATLRTGDPDRAGQGSFGDNLLPAWLLYILKDCDPTDVISYEIPFRVIDNAGKLVRSLVACRDYAAQKYVLGP
jgi:hypothetical protein